MLSARRHRSNRVDGNMYAPEFVCLTGWLGVSWLVTSRGRFNSFTPFHHSGDLHGSGMPPDVLCTMRGIFRLGLLRGSSRRILQNRAGTRHAWHIRAEQRLFAGRRMLLPAYISHARPGWLSLSREKENAKAEPWMAWRIAGASVSDTSDFSIKFSRRGNLSPVTPPGKIRSSHSREAIPITIARRFREAYVSSRTYDDNQLISFWTNKWNGWSVLKLCGNFLTAKKSK